MSAQAPSFEEQLADIIVTTVRAAIAPLQSRLAALEGKASGGAPSVDRDFDARLKALEARPGPVYAGTFESGASYVRGALVTRNGGMWLALRDTSRTPGSAPDDWKLVVKSGGA